MFRSILAVCAVLVTLTSARAADPKPLWEIATPGDKVTAPAWLGYSPDGTAIVAVVVHQGPTQPAEYTYTLRVWDAKTRKERFTAALGTGKSPTWGDDLVSFPTDDSILTGGQELTVRDLLDGKERTITYSGGSSDHSVWFVRDLQETFHLRREPDREGKPVELVIARREPTTTNFRGSDFGAITRRFCKPRFARREQECVPSPSR